jgi:HAD superfamily hydrolase (TIGR01509 family)
MTIRAAVFDLGNTLWFAGKEPSKAEADRIAAELLQSWVARYRPAISEPIETICREVWEAYETAWRVEVERGALRDPSLAFLARGAFAVRGVTIDEAQATAFWRESWIGVRRFGVELYPDALDVLRELRRRGVLIGINSNRPCTVEIMMRDLEDMELAPYVDAAICSGEVGYIKPHPATFERIVDDLGVAPSEAVMIGDSCEADMQGAKALGMRTVLKLNGRYGLDPCAHADHEIHDLSELLALPLFGWTPAPAMTDSLTPHEDGNADRY